MELKTTFNVKSDYFSTIMLLLRGLSKTVLPIRPLSHLPFFSPSIIASVQLENDILIEYSVTVGGAVR